MRYNLVPNGLDCLRISFDPSDLIKRLILKTLGPLSTHPILSDVLHVAGEGHIPVDGAGHVLQAHREVRQLISEGGAGVPSLVHLVGGGGGGGGEAAQQGEDCGDGEAETFHPLSLH